MLMSNSETHRQDTQHAFLVAWGWFAEHLGLIQQLQAVSLKQKSYHHRPQTKVLEFLVAILAGLQHLQEISLAAHPLDKDQAVAQAWGQPAWADYSGVSRTLSSLSWEEVKQIVQVLEQVSQPAINALVAGAACAREAGAYGWRSDRHSRVQYQPDLSQRSLWVYE
jgi:hypothetical protein